VTVVIIRMSKLGLLDARECVVAVAAQRHPISAGRPDTARIDDLFDR
jgi:hypothetical protein